ncbi:MAG TPA: DciA family protein [Methylophilaceae bacterium]|jgi:hypothetical protein
MQRFNAFLRYDARLARFAEKAEHLSEVQDLWHSILPKNLRPYTQAGDVDHKRLTVYASNAAAAAKIKLLLPSLLTRLQKHGLEVTSIRVRVQVQSDPRKPVKMLRNLSPKAAIRLDQLADSIDNNPALTEALKRLASRAR